MYIYFSMYKPILIGLSTVPRLDWTSPLGAAVPPSPCGGLPRDRPWRVGISLALDTARGETTWKSVTEPWESLVRGIIPFYKWPNSSVCCELL